MLHIIHTYNIYTDNQNKNAIGLIYDKKKTIHTVIYIHIHVYTQGIILEW